MPSLVHPSRRPFVILSVLYTAVLFSSTAWQHYLLGSQVWDLGIFEQFNWLIANGGINQISSLRNIPPCRTTSPCCCSRSRWSTSSRPMPTRCWGCSRSPLAACPHWRRISVCAKG